MTSTPASRSTPLTLPNDSVTRPARSIATFARATSALSSARVVIDVLGRAARQWWDPHPHRATGSVRPGEVWDRAAEIRIGRAAQLPTDRVEPLVDVRVEEREDQPERLTERLVVTLLAGGQPRVGDVAGADQLLEAVGDRPVQVDPKTVGPEPAPDRDRGGVERAKASGRVRRRHDRG